MSKRQSTLFALWPKSRRLLGNSREAENVVSGAELVNEQSDREDVDHVPEEVTVVSSEALQLSDIARILVKKYLDNNLIEDTNAACL